MEQPSRIIKKVGFIPAIQEGKSNKCTSLPYGNLENQYFYVSICIVTYVLSCSYFILILTILPCLNS